MSRNRVWPARILGGLFALIGLILTIGGAWLSADGGSLYYLVAGVALVVSGVLLIRRRVEGAWVYIGLVAVTVAWAFWETGGNA